MSYQVLARKWRPQQFKDLIGQEHVVRALVNALDNNRLHHAYLFTGIRGVGKTTIARILAKSLNCEKGVSSEPCGECGVCKDIEAGSFFDLIEVDAASRTKAEETRELLSNVPYAPASGRYKVYLIDEVHMFSNHSFNALLKTLEEPPEHVKFLLATTDPQKLPVTVLSRCLQLHLKGLPQRRLAEYLQKLLQAESIDYDDSALSLIARAADGSVRDSLSLVEQASAMGNGSITVDNVESMLGRLSADRVLELLEAVAAGDGALAMQRLEALAEYGPDYQQLLGDLVSLLHHIAMSKTVPGAQRSLSTLDASRLDALCEKLSDEDVQLYYQIGLHGRRDIPHSPDPREALEMTLLRMIAFRPQEGAGGTGTAGSGENPDGTQTSEPPTINQAEDNSSAAPTNAPASALSDGPQAAAAGHGEPPAVEVGIPGSQSSTGTPVASRAGVTPAVTSQAVTAEPVLSAASAPPAVANVSVAAEPPANVPALPQAAEQDVTAASATTTQEAPGDTAVAPPAEEAPYLMPDGIRDAVHWTDVAGRLGLRGLPAELAMNCSPADISVDKIVFVTGSEHEHLATARAVEQFKAAVTRALGHETNVVIETGEPAGETPAQCKARLQQEKQTAAEQSINADPVVQNLLQKVDGAVEPASVRPLTKEMVPEVSTEIPE